MENFPLVSIIIPVKNEAILLRRCLASLKNLDYPEDKLEIIIADGLSTDNTKEVIKEFKVKQVINEKQVVVSARNRGFTEAKGKIVAFTDADCVFSRDWLKNSIKYFSDDKVAGVGGSTITPGDSSGFEKAIGFLFYAAGLFNASSHRSKITVAKETKDIPGCNAIYRKEALARVMPVDESLLTAEDVWMNFSLRKLGYKLILADDVCLWHYRRSNLRRFLRQAYRFAVGRVQVAKKNPNLISFFHVIAGLSLPVFLISAIIFYLLRALPLFFILNLILFFALAFFSLFETKSPKAALNFPLVLIAFLIGWSAGFLKELFFPLRDVKGK